MSSHRSILAPVSRKPKHKSQHKAAGEHDIAVKNTVSATRFLSKSEKPSRQKTCAFGMFGAWFDEAKDYDEEEDSKTWEQPWSLPPVPPMPCSYSSPSEKPRIEQRQTSKPPSQTKTPVKQSRGNLFQVQDVLRGAAKQDRKGQSKKQAHIIKTFTAPPVNLPTPSPSASPASTKSVRAFQAPQLEVVPKSHVKLAPRKQTTFFSLSLEVRDKIYGHLLTATIPITVMRGWTQCYGRYRGGLEPAIISVCRQTYEEGIRILYSTNTFLYLIRDAGDPIPEALRPEGYASPMALSLDPPPLSELKSTNSKGKPRKRQKGPAKTKMVARKSTVGDAHRVIYLAKYAHLFRRVDILLESNRDTDQYRVAMAKAIQLLVEFRANLTSLQFSLTPLERDAKTKPGQPASQEWTVVDFFSSTATEASPKQTKPKDDKLDVMNALRDLTVRLLHFTVYTPASRRLDMTLDMTHLATDPGLTRLLAQDNLITQQRLETAKASSEAFGNLRFLIEDACANTDEAARGGWWTEYGPPEVAAVRSAMDGLDTMKDKMRKYNSAWYEKARRAYGQNCQPEHAGCVRKVGRKLQVGNGE